SLDDGQAQAGAGHAGTRGFAAGKGAQQSFGVLGVDARAIVADIDFDHAAFLADPHQDMRLAVSDGPAIAATVFNQIADYSLQVKLSDPGVQIRLDHGAQCAAQ